MITQTPQQVDDAVPRSSAVAFALILHGLLYVAMTVIPPGAEPHVSPRPMIVAELELELEPVPVASPRAETNAPRLRVTPEPIEAALVTIGVSAKDRGAPLLAEATVFGEVA